MTGQHQDQESKVFYELYALKLSQESSCSDSVSDEALHPFQLKMMTNNGFLIDWF